MNCFTMVRLMILVSTGVMEIGLNSLYERDVHEKFYRDRPKGTPPPGELNTRGVAKYSDFGPIKGYISETVQDGR